jgi:hypothetical protein
LAGAPGSGAERRGAASREPPIYAGIGSRETPPRVLQLIETIAERLANDGWVLRTGLSPGADQAFYRGARAGQGRVELYLPWPRFQQDARLDTDARGVSVLSSPSKDACELGARFHPAWDGLGRDARRLLARDGHQVLGANLKTPARLIVCWTPDGSLDGTGPLSGGSGQALRIAHDRGIEVLSLARDEHLRRLGLEPDRPEA